MTRSLAISFFLVLTALPCLAHSQTEPAALECSEYVPPEERKDTKRLALRGVACFEAGNYLVALRHYRRAREFSDANLFNAALGRTFQELGYPFIAERYYRDYLSGKIEDSASRAKIEDRLSVVEKEIDDAARVRFQSSPPGAVVYVVIEDTHREELGETPLDLRMQPGRHTFVVEREGYVSHTMQVDAGSKQNRVVNAELVEEGAAFDVSGRRLRRTGIITMGASVPLLAIGSSLYLIGRNKRGAVDEQPAGERADARADAMRMQSGGIATTVVGIATLGTGLTLYLVGRSADAPVDAPVKKESSIHPYTDGRTVGLVVSF